MHVALNYRCLGGLGSGAVEADDSRMAVAFYSLAAMDLCGVALSKPSEKDREEWVQWIWEQYIRTPEGAGFRGGDSLALPGNGVCLLFPAIRCFDQTEQLSSRKKRLFKLLLI
ncbi:hypothetical protein FRC11_007517 [Ceratobasidium sp. 423]|nr:hypothetical protein FRC11_007517 [Ceratobasidium sp. 423]